MRTLTAMGLACALAAPAWGANVTSFTGFLRKAPAPVTVPGGTTTFVRWFSGVRFRDIRHADFVFVSLAFFVV